MDSNSVQQLHDRNKRIIQAVIRKADSACPGSVALIGITGSFSTGDIHDKSDLDLCIVINDDAGWKVRSCFILGDVAHDIHCTPWSRLEEMARYTDPYVGKLLHLHMVYCADDRNMQRYTDLREQLKSKLSAPFCMEDIDKAERHLSDALKAYGQVMLGQSVGECRYAAAEMLRCMEYTFYMLNKTYVKRGIRRIPEEIRVMKRLPDGFLDIHRQVVEADSVGAIRDKSTRLMRLAMEFVRELRSQSNERKEMTSSALVGTYEEIHSNWRNKMHHAAESGDVYLSLMSTTSCQEFYDEMNERYNMQRVNVIESFDPHDLRRSAKGFDAAMEHYRELYAKLGVPVRHYLTIEAFEEAYLSGSF